MIIVHCYLDTQLHFRLKKYYFKGTLVYYTYIQIGHVQTYYIFSNLQFLFFGDISFSDVLLYECTYKIPLLVLLITYNIYIHSIESKNLIIL